jgi:hypothetical protein
MRLGHLVACGVLMAVAPCQAQSAWTLAADLRIGGGFDGPTSFAAIGGIAVPRNGNIFVVDLRPLQIKLFSPAGDFLRYVGREGAGSNEYTSVGAITVDADGNVQVVAPAMGRILIYSPAGDLVRQVSASLASTSVWEGAVALDGSVLDPIWIPTGRQTSSGSEELERRLQRLRRDGTRADTLAFPGCRAANAPADPYLRFQNPSGSVVRTLIADLPHAQTVFAPDGTAWCAPGDPYTIYHLRVGRSDTLHVVRVNIPAQIIPEAERARAMERYARAVNYDAAVVPKVRPALDVIRVDDANRLWVRRSDTPIDAPQFDVFDSKGAPVATVHTDLRWVKLPVVAGNYAYGVVPDEGGQPYLVRALIRK